VVDAIEIAAATAAAYESEQQEADEQASYAVAKR
jgi:hypothetical protein